MAPVRSGKFVIIAEDSGSSSDEDDTSNKRVKPNPAASDNSSGSGSSSEDSSEAENDSFTRDDRIGGNQPPTRAMQAASPAAEESSDESTDSSDEDEGIIGRLKEFLISSERVLTLKGTSTLDRKLAHSWVETHRDAAVRSWGHVAKLVGAERVMTITKSDEYVASSSTASESHETPADNSDSESDSAASASDKSSTDDSGSESDDEIEDAGVLGRLKRFYKSPEQVLIFKDTTAPDRSAIHKWVEGHDDPVVRGWGHTSKTVGTSRVMTVTKRGPSGPSDAGQKKRLDSAPAASDRPSKKSRTHGSAGGDGETARRFEDGKHILFIGQLPYDATASQIQGHFETAAAVEIMGGSLAILGVRLLTDPISGKSRGMAFVDCAGDDDLERGVHMHQSKLLGRRINVEKSASGGGKTDRRKRFIQKSKEEYEEIRRSRVAEALESRLRRVDHELGVDDVDDEIRGFLLSVPVHVAVEALDEFHTAVVKTPPTSRRAYLMGVLKRLHNETDSTMPLNKRRGHDRKKGGGGSRGGARGAGRGRGASSFAPGGIGGAFGASARGGRGGGGRGGKARGSKW